MQFYYLDRLQQIYVEGIMREPQADKDNQDKYNSYVVVEFLR